MPASNSSHMQLLPDSRVRETARSLASLGPTLHRAIRGQVTPAAHLSMPQFITLMTLLEGPRPAGFLAEKFGVSRPTVTRLVDGLVRKALVERLPQQSDRRVALVTLTESGRALQIATQRAAEDYLVGLLASLSLDRLDRLDGAMRDVLDLLSGAPRVESVATNQERDRAVNKLLTIDQGSSKVRGLG